jgi:hypothetical protein
MTLVKGMDLFEILTPSDPDQRGAQLSLKFFANVKYIHEELESFGIVVGDRIYSCGRVVCNFFSIQVRLPQSQRAPICTSASLQYIYRCLQACGSFVQVVSELIDFSFCLNF